MTGKRQYRVAVVYHAPVYQEGIALVLEQDERLRITARYASLDALALAVQRGEVEKPDVVLLELAPPWEAQWGALLQWREQWPKVGVLALGELTEQLAQGALEGGANGVVAVTVAGEELQEAVYCVAAGGLYRNSWLERNLRAGRNSRGARQQAVPKLTPQQAVVLRLMARSDSPTYASIAQEMGIGVRTVECYRDDLFAKFDVHTRGALLYRARELRLV